MSSPRSASAGASAFCAALTRAFVVIEAAVSRWPRPSCKSCPIRCRSLSEISSTSRSSRTCSASRSRSFAAIVEIAPGKLADLVATRELRGQLCSSLAKSENTVRESAQPRRDGEMKHRPEREAEQGHGRGHPAELGARVRLRSSDRFSSVEHLQRPTRAVLADAERMHTD